ncbi:hypothetical protein [Nocardia thailandica]|uniref:hypothetical protein n=1 Tax=Nocardia thailandica TaxID=257275 RepID=UPI0003070F9F|nr:hypothetical protein [Nocardia thailandica]
MLSFHCIGATGTIESAPQIQPYREALWAAAFDVDSLEGLFDMTPAARAIEILDAAIARFNAIPDELRVHLDPADRLGLRGNRLALAGIRAFLADYGGTISGAFEAGE